MIILQPVIVKRGGDQIVETSDGICKKCRTKACSDLLYAKLADMKGICVREQMLKIVRKHRNGKKF